MWQAKDGPVPLDPQNDVKYQYLWNCREYLDPLTKIVIATDADEPGQALAEELSRRLGRERCWRVMWPTTLAEVPGNEFIMQDDAQPEPTEKSTAIFRKDANEVLIKDGPAALEALIQQVGRLLPRLGYCFHQALTLCPYQGGFFQSTCVQTKPPEAWRV
jgi:twinkle protein